MNCSFRTILFFAVLLSVGLTGCAQHEVDPSTKNILSLSSSNTNLGENYQGPGSLKFENHIHSEFEYADTSLENVIVQNGYPKGGGLIDADPQGITYGHAVFFTRVVNKTSKSMVLKLNFPADSLTIPTSPEEWFKVFVLPDPMSPDEGGEWSYGVTGLPEFLRPIFYRGTSLEKILKPGEEIIFNVALLSHITNHGVSRSALMIEQNELYYKLDLNPLKPIWIPCGEITFL